MLCAAHSSACRQVGGQAERAPEDEDPSPLPSGLNHSTLTALLESLLLDYCMYHTAQALPDGHVIGVIRVIIPHAASLLPSRQGGGGAEGYYLSAW